MYASKLSQIVLIFIVIIGCLSAWSGKGIFAAKIDSGKTGTGLQTVTSSNAIPKATAHSTASIRPLTNEHSKPKTEERIVSPEKESIACDTKCKVDQLTKLGIRPEIASSLVTNCKALADNPVHCIKFWAALVANESGGWYKCRKRNQYNCSWMDVHADYRSYNDGILHWIGKYNKYWYKAKDMSHFYSVAWTLPPTKYCTSEASSKTSVGCPFWLRHSTSFLNKITF